MKVTNLFENAAKHQQIKDWLDKMHITKYTINDNGVVDVDGSVIVFDNNITSFPVQFGHVSGFFDCSRNRLISLQGAPTEVGGAFHCSYNLLTSLQGSPREVRGDYVCCGNQLTSLQGAPREILSNFICSENQLTSLRGGPMEVGRIYSCYSNQLTTLRGCAMEIGYRLDCWNNPFEVSPPDSSFITVGSGGIRYK